MSDDQTTPSARIRSIDEELAKMEEEYRLGLEDRAQAVEREGQSFFAGTGPMSDDLKVMIHKLAGTAGSYGLPQISGAAGGIERSWRAGTDDDTIRRDIKALIELLIETAAD